MKWLIILLVTSFLFGCLQTKGRACLYPLKERGWGKTKNISSELINSNNEKYSWFINHNGDYLACPKKVGSNFCGSVYIKYIKHGNGAYKEEEIVCTS